MTKNVRISEIYASIQGEGPRTGMPTLFLRFGGCNLRCPGWPCDTLFAVLPENASRWPKRSPEDVLADVLAECKRVNIANVCLTGGEPFLQNSEALELIVDGLQAEDIGVEAFSNGQINYPQWAFDKVNFVMDWKLPGSGNPATTLTEANAINLSPTDAIKFVILDEEDFRHAINVWAELEDRVEAQWWAGVVWEGGMQEHTLAEKIVEEGLPWNLNVQTHKYLWDPDKRGV